MLNATSEAVRLDDEPVTLPPVGKRVLACTIRKRPMLTTAVFEAFRKFKPFEKLEAGPGKSYECAVAAYIESGDVLAEGTFTLVK